MITQDFPPALGGIQTYSLELARWLAQMCDDFAVVAPSQPQDTLLDRALDFELHRVPARSDHMAVAAVPSVVRLTRGRRFDAVFHTHWSTAPAGLVARRVGAVKRVFVAGHGRELLLTPGGSLGRAALSRTRAAILRRVDRCFPVSDFTAGIFADQGVPPERIVVVRNGADPERFMPGDGGPWRRAHGLAERPTLLTMSRLVPRKGIDTVLRALAHVQTAVPNVAYVVVGEGPDRGRLVSLARDLGVAARVNFVGAAPPQEAAAALRAADVFVMPARSNPPDVEGFGLVFLEASACGIPVVGARAGGVPEAIVDGETGHLVPPDDPVAVARTLVDLLQDPARARRLGQQGRARVVAAHTWQHVATRLFNAMLQTFA